MPDTSLESIYKYRAVDDSIATSGQPSEKQLLAIADAGFKTVVNLALHDDPRYSLPDEPGIVASSGMAYIHIPVQFSAPSENDLQQFFTAMDACSAEKVWIHCAANIRVSALLGLYRFIKQDWKPESAFALMNELWQPDAVWWSFIEKMLRTKNA